MTDAFLATEPQPDSLLPAEYVAHPSYAFRAFRCAACGLPQYDAGQNACLYCGAFWTLELIWPQTSPSAQADEGA